MLKLVQLLFPFRAGAGNILPGVLGPCRSLRSHFKETVSLHTLFFEHVMLQEKESGKKKKKNKNPQRKKSVFCCSL